MKVIIFLAACVVTLATVESYILRPLHFPGVPFMAPMNPLAYPRVGPYYAMAQPTATVVRNRETVNYKTTVNVQTDTASKPDYNPATGYPENFKYDVTSDPYMFGATDAVYLQ